MPPKLRDVKRSSPPTQDVDMPLSPPTQDVDMPDAGDFHNATCIVRQKNQVLLELDQVYFVKKFADIPSTPHYAQLRTAMESAHPDGELASISHKEEMIRIAKENDHSNIEWVTSSRRWNGKSLYIAKKIGDPELLRSYPTNVDKIPYPGTGTPFFQQLKKEKPLKKMVTETNHPNGSGVNSVVRHSVIELKQLLVKHGQIIIAKEGEQYLVETDGEDYPCIKRRHELSKTCWDSLGTPNHELAPAQHVDELMNIIKKGNDYVRAHAQRIVQVDTSGGAIWLLEFKDYPYQLRIHDSYADEMAHMFGVDDISHILDLDESDSGVQSDPIGTIVNDEPGSRFTVHAHHLHFGAPKTAKTEHLVEDEHGRWSRMTLAQLEQHDYIDLDYKTGFNPGMDKSAIETVRKIQKLEKDKISIKGVVALPRNPSPCLTVIFDLKDEKPKKDAISARKEFVERNKQKLPDRAFEGFFRLSITEFNKIDAGLHAKVLEHAQVGGKVEQLWAKRHPKKSKGKSHNYRELTPAQDASIRAHVTDLSKKVDDNTEMLKDIRIVITDIQDNMHRTLRV